MAKSKFIEALEEQYTKKDSKSVLRYKAPDNKWRYVQTSKDASGGNMPSGGGITEVTWQELKDKRGNGELNPGSLYRITDYNCTTTQENTRSAGHQFDIILLALSENKLAEEGWAMEHPTDVYDVTFSDGVTKKCYIYETTTSNRRKYNVVEVDTKIGASNVYEEDDITINEKTKTAIIEGPYANYMTEENLTYNYFQNSNLSAWKVWYCLDNDTSRFAWADDASEESIIPSAQDSSYVRDTYEDVDGLYAWTNDDSGDSIYTKTTNPIVGDEIYDNEGTSIQETIGSINGFGRGVIYRLIDECNNDVGYDFKNIQFNKEMLDSTMWCYTFTNIDEGGNLYDCSTYNDGFVYNNFIEKTIDIMEGGKCLSNNVLIYPTSCCIKYSTNNLLIGSSYVTLINSSGCEINNSLNGLELITCHDFTPSDGYGIYINNKKVLTEV